MVCYLMIGRRRLNNFHYKSKLKLEGAAITVVCGPHRLGSKVLIYCFCLLFSAIIGGQIFKFAVAEL